MTSQEAQVTRNSMAVDDGFPLLVGKKGKRNCLEGATIALVRLDAEWALGKELKWRRRMRPVAADGRQRRRVVFRQICI